jgi:hypothetical protein
MVQDNRETIVVNLEHDLLFKLMLLAHERDITLNELVELALIQYIEIHKIELND